MKTVLLALAIAAALAAGCYYYCGGTCPCGCNEGGDCCCVSK